MIKVLRPLITVVLIVTAVAIVFMSRFIYSNFNYLSPGLVTVEIPKGAGLNSVAARLEDRGVIKDRRFFAVYAIFKQGENRIKAGEYRFETGVSFSGVLEKILKGEVVLRRVTVPEGLTVLQTAQLLEQNGVFEQEEFITISSDRDFVYELLGERLESLEGYLYPDTYTYPKSVLPKEFISSMVARYKSVMAAMDLSNSGLDEHELITLASIIEKETGAAQERPTISAVLHNRLKRGMRLEADPTVIYGMGEKYTGNITKVDLETPTPYNTYIISGLPPGPIASPGLGSITAALMPSGSDFLYFVAKGDGTHEFSKTYKEHIKNVRKYQRRARH